MNTRDGIATNARSIDNNRVISLALEICKECGKELTWIPQYNRYYCFDCEKYPPTCPTCNRDLFWVKEYNRYYCNDCKKYPDITDSETIHEQTFPENNSSSDKYSIDQVSILSQYMKEEYENGDISKSEYQKLLENFKFIDEEGIYWTIGASTGSIYFHDGNQWIKAITKQPKTLKLVDFS